MTVGEPSLSLLRMSMAAESGPILRDDMLDCDRTRGCVFGGRSPVGVFERW